MLILDFSGTEEGLVPRCRGRGSPVSNPSFLGVEETTYSEATLTWVNHKRESLIKFKHYHIVFSNTVKVRSSIEAVISSLFYLQ